MRKHSIRLLSLLLLAAFTLVGCKKDNFDHVETTVPTPEVTVPWSNSGEFTYTASQDDVSNVINWTYLSGASEIFPYGNDLYFYGHFQASRYDPETGRQTFLCADPVCDHISDCPLYLMQSNFKIVEDKVIFYRTNRVDDSDILQVMLYSITDRTLKVLRTIEGNGYVMQIIALEDSYFFYDWVYNEATGKHTYSLCRQYYDSGEIEVLDQGDSLSSIPSIVGTNGDLVYLYDDSTSALITRSLKDMTETARVEIDSDYIALCKDGYLIYMVEGELFRMSLDGTDRRSLEIRNADYFYLTDSFIYYRKVEGKKSGIEHDAHYGDTEIEVDLQAIYRVDHDGKNETLVWKNADENNILAPQDFVVQGNYIYTSFSYYQFDGDSVTTESSRTMTGDRTPYYCRLDCTTSEVYYIETEKLNFHD